MDIKRNIDNAKKILDDGGNIIKTRDDRELILVNAKGLIQNPNDCEWGINDTDVVEKPLFRKRIEPWLTSLFQSEHLSLLCGSGISNAISHKAGANGGAAESNSKCKFMQPYRKNASLECRSQFSPVDDG